MSSVSESFMRYVKAERESFITAFLATIPDTELKVKAENLIIAYDQMAERLKGNAEKLAAASLGGG